MKIAIVLAISVIFSSGIYAAYADEPSPELIFEGGDYTIYRGNQILVPITVQIENHDHKIFPKLNISFENRIITILDLRQSNSGYYQTFLNINENYATGEYHLELDYNGKKSVPVVFNIIREHENQIKDQEKDYSKILYKPKESEINLSQEHFDIEFSTKTKQHVTGVYDSRGASGKLLLNIDGPKSMNNEIRLLEFGNYETYILIDKEWPTGTYKVTGIYQGNVFAEKKFTIKNFNKDSLLTDEPIGGVIHLDSIKSNQFNVITINGQLSAKVFPNQIGIKIFYDKDLIDILYNDIKNDGSFQSSLVLYDYLKKSELEYGKYTVEIVDSGTLETYGIKADFEISKSGNVITEFEHGMLLTSNESESELLNFVQEIEVKKYHPKEIKIYGIIEDYISGTPIIISIVNEQGNVDKFSIFGKKNGQYDAPVIIDSEWISGKYNIYVHYKDVTQNSVSFNIDEKNMVLKSEDMNESSKVKESYETKKFNIIQTDSSTNEFVKLEFSTKAHEIGYNRIDVTIEKPNGDTSSYKPRTAMDGKFDVSLFIENSWDEGDYFLSFIEDGEKIVFGEFSITKEKKQSKSIILSQILETANPKSAYEQKDELKISKKKFASSNEGIYLDIFGTIKNYSSGKALVNVYDKNTLFSTHKISPKSDGNFFSTILIDREISIGFHEIDVTYDERVIGKSEIFITTPIKIYPEFGSKPIKISQDMFIESNNKIDVNILGMVEGFTNTSHNSIELSILHPDGKIEHIQLDNVKWGYYSYTLPVTEKWENGTYVISVYIDGKKLDHTYMQITDFDINWLKTYTQKWIDGESSSYQYENRIKRIIQHGFIEIDHVEQDSLPDWMKMNAKKWIDGEISQKEYFDIVKFIFS